MLRTTSMGKPAFRTVVNTSIPQASIAGRARSAWRHPPTSTRTTCTGSTAPPPTPTPSTPRAGRFPAPARRRYLLDIHLRLEVNEDCPAVRVQHLPHLLRRRRVRRAHQALGIPIAPELTFEPDPSGRLHVGPRDDLRRLDPGPPAPAGTAPHRRDRVAAVDVLPLRPIAPSHQTNPTITVPSPGFIPDWSPGRNGELEGHRRDRQADKSG